MKRLQFRSEKPVFSKLHLNARNNALSHGNYLSNSKSFYEIQLISKYIENFRFGGRVTLSPFLSLSLFIRHLNCKLYIIYAAMVFVFFSFAFDSNHVFRTIQSFFDEIDLNTYSRDKRLFKSV